MAKKNNADATGFWLQPVAIGQGLLVIVLLLVLMSVALAVVVHFSSWTASSRLFNVLVHLGVFAGAIFSGIKCKRKAWLHGVVVGVFAYLFLSIIGYDGPLFVTWFWWKGLLKMTLITMLGGIVGGLFHS